jgi:hypothetical protein
MVKYETIPGLNKLQPTVGHGKINKEKKKAFTEEIYITETYFR